MIILGLGTNLGDRKFNLESARKHISSFMDIVHTSSTYETKACYVEDQPDFLNQVIAGKSDLNYRSLFLEIKAIELQMGRETTFRYGPRFIDIDLLYYNNLIINSDDLIIPHRRIEERRFVLEPLCEILPDWVCPKSSLSVKEMCLKLNF